MRHNIILSALIIFCMASCQQKRQSTQENLEFFHLSKVRLLPGPFMDAQSTDFNYMMKMDVDRLLAPYLEDAGFDPVKPHYDNWEGSGLNGHIGGHYLSALAMMYASTGEDSMKVRLEYMIDWLAKCQEANGNGYVGGIPDGKRIWGEIAKGEIDAGSFSLNKGWVPIYNIHKLFAGLRDAYEFASNEKAFKTWIGLSDWWIDMMSQLSDEQIQEILRSEHGGINEVFADLYVHTQDKKYLEMANKLSHNLLLDPLSNHSDSLTGMHANTQIPKVIGFQRIASITDSSSYHEAAAYFWDNVVEKRTISIGGNSVREHFHPINDFSNMLSSEQGPETCNTYNMLRLSKSLFMASGDRKYVDFYEKGLYNHILSSQHPDGGFVYFTPARPRHYRVYSQPDKGMWCCVGSGLENHTKYGELIYAHQGSDLLVNLFISSVLNWEEEGIVLTQQTDFPNEDQTTLKIETKSAKGFALKIRVPGWVAGGDLEVLLNGEPLPDVDINGGYAVINREWSNGDVITAMLPMKTTLEQLPDGSSWYSFMHGPIVLAAVTDSTDIVGLWADDGRMSHVANGPFYPSDKAPMLIGNEAGILNATLKNSSEPLSFNYNGSVYPNEFQGLTLVPFYKIHEARYMLYWPMTDSAGLDTKIKMMAEEEKARQTLNAITVDYVSSGEQQSESDHFIDHQRTWVGYAFEEHWREGRGWFSYKMNNKAAKAKYLYVKYVKAEHGRACVISINEERVGELDVDEKSQEIIGFTTFTIPKTFQLEDKLELKIQAKEDKLMMKVIEVRLLTKVLE